MGLFGPQRRAFFGITGAEDLIPGRSFGGTRAVGNVVVTDDKAMRNSVVWACLRLRAGLVSTFPVDQYRDVLGIQTEWPMMPPILTDPGGRKMDMVDFMAATQLDLDRSGNTVGLIVDRAPIGSKYHPRGLPRRIELQPAAACTYLTRPGKPDRWRINGDFYDPEDVYHERANVISGFQLGLPTVLYAAATIGEALNMQEFGLDWFGNGGIPKARMRNTAKRLGPNDTSVAKQWYRDTIVNGDVMVMGADWEYDLIQAQTAGMEFIEGRKFAGADICRFFDTPADLVDVQASSGGSITYANITERNLQFLIYHMGPTTIRREKELTKLIPTPRYVKLNTDALLRMDPATRQKVLKSRIDSRLLTNTEGRALENLPPLTDAQIDEFEKVYGPPKSAGSTKDPSDSGAALAPLDA
jgi:HK97 family phage portal protein